MLAQSPVYMYVKTKNMNRAFAFYTRTLDLDGVRGKGVMKNAWASVKTANGKLWLGPHGASTGLIFIVKSLEKTVKQLQGKKISFFIPAPMKKHGMKTHIADHPWGRHAWFKDSEGNTVMLFEPKMPRL